MTTTENPRLRPHGTPCPVAILKPADANEPAGELRAETELSLAIDAAIEAGIEVLCAELRGEVAA